MVGTLGIVVLQQEPWSDKAVWLLCWALEGAHAWEAVEWKVELDKEAVAAVGSDEEQWEQEFGIALLWSRRRVSILAAVGIVEKQRVGLVLLADTVVVELQSGGLQESRRQTSLALVGDHRWIVGEDVQAGTGLVAAVAGTALPQREYGFVDPETGRLEDTVPAGLLRSKEKHRAEETRPLYFVSVKSTDSSIITNLEDAGPVEAQEGIQMPQKGRDIHMGVDPVDQTAAEVDGPLKLPEEIHSPVSP